MGLMCLGFNVFGVNHVVITEADDFPYHQISETL